MRKSLLSGIATIVLSVSGINAQPVGATKKNIYTKNGNLFVENYNNDQAAMIIHDFCDIYAIAYVKATKTLQIYWKGRKEPAQFSDVEPQNKIIIDYKTWRSKNRCNIEVK